MRSFTCFLWLFTLGAGCVLEDKFVEVPDGSVEAGMCGFCEAKTPVCIETTLTCVQCTGEDPRACIDDTPICNAENECVECVASSDCNDPVAARCDTDLNECVGCESATDCDGIDGSPACNEVTQNCVPCTTDANCNGKACNTTTFECTNTDVGGLGTCEQCVVDSECGEDGAPSDNDRCVPMSYEDRPFPNDETGFCLKVFSPGGCQQPYAIELSPRRSFSGDPVQSYCGINEILATCPAVRALDRNAPCPGGEDSECPISGLCRDVGGLADRCTYPCSDETQCDEPPNPGSTCGSSGSGGDDYCGG